MEMSLLRGRMRPLLVVLALALAALGTLALAPAPAASAAPAQAGACTPSPTANYGATGPFAVTVQPESAHTYYRPTNLGSGGCTRHPVILWGNGTFTTPSFYDALLRHLASHGFIVAAANTSNAGTGQEMLQGLTNLASFNGQSGSPYYQRVDLDRVGTTGHSQGGSGAVRAALDARVDTTFPLEPGLGTARGIHGTALYFAGQNDTIISPTYVRSSFWSKRLPACPLNRVRLSSPASISWPLPALVVFAAATTKPWDARWRRNAS